MEVYRGRDLLVSREEAVALGENENFIVDLMGMEVWTDEEERLGLLTDVLKTGANDVYVVETEDKKEVHIPEGLLE